jgi:biopolymer transport protein ExbB
VIIAKFWTLWIAHHSTQLVLAEVEEAADAGRLDEALELATARRGPAAAILVVGLRRIEAGESAQSGLTSAIRTTGTIELGFLERGLVILATIANVAPLMGFLGTVIGMILAFAAIEAAGDVDPTLVAGGIKVALLTTATGLLIAIPVNIGYNFFVTRIDTLILDMEQGAQRVLDLAWGLQLQGRATVPSGPAAQGSGHPRAVEPPDAGNGG